MPLSQRSLRQSAFSWQLCPSRHLLGQLPPQSTSVSSPLCTTSAHVAAAHAILRRQQQRGRGGTFLFIDPWGGTEHVCCFDRDATITRWKAEANIETELVIREVAG